MKQGDRDQSAHRKGIIGAGLTEPGEAVHAAQHYPAGDGRSKRELPSMTFSESAESTGCCRGLACSLARRNELPGLTIFLGQDRMLLSRAALVELLAEPETTRDDG